MRLLTVVGLDGEGEVEVGEDVEAEEEGLVMDQYVARPFHSQREEWVVFVRGTRMELGGR